MKVTACICPVDLFEVFSLFAFTHGGLCTRGRFGGNADALCRALVHIRVPRVSWAPAVPAYVIGSLAFFP